MTHSTRASTNAQISLAIRDRRSIRAFAPEPVSLDLVRDLLGDAMWAPSPHNTQPWRFTVLHDKADKTSLASAMAARLALDMRASGASSDVIERQTERSCARVSQAPIVVVCSLARDGLNVFDDERLNALEWQMAVQSVGAVLQSLFLLAAARGIGTCWMAAPMYCPDEVRAAIQIHPDWHPQALVLMGRPALPGKVRDRRDPASVVDVR